MTMNINKEKFSDACISQDLGESGSAQVDLFNGNLTFVHTDVQFNYGNPIISVGHVYSAKAQSSGAYGNNWSLNCDEKVETLEGGIGINHYDASGNITYYRRANQDIHNNYSHLIDVANVNVMYLSIQSNDIIVQYNIVQDGMSYGCRYIIIDSKGNKKSFTKFTIIDTLNPQTFYLEKIELIDGNYITYTRNKSNNITKIEDKHGRFVNFTYNTNGKLRSIKDSAGRNKDYSYENDNLVTIYYGFSDSTNLPCVNFEYNSNNQITRIIGRNGISYLYEYPENSARVSKITKQSKYKTIGLSTTEGEDYLSYESWDITYNLDGLGVAENKEYDNVNSYAEFVISKVVTNLGVTYYYGFKTDNGFYYYNAFSYEGDKYKIGVAKDTMSIRTSQSSDRLIISTAKDNLLKNFNFDSTEHNPEKGYYPMDWQGFYEGNTENYVYYDTVDNITALVISADGREHCIYQTINNENTTSSLGEVYNSLSGGMYSLCARIKGGLYATTKEFALQVKYYNCPTETVSLENISEFGNNNKWTYVLKSVYLPNTKQDDDGVERGIESIKVCINFNSTYSGNNNNLLIDYISLNCGKANIMKSEPILVCNSANGQVVYKMEDIDRDNSTVTGAEKPTTFTARWLQEQLLCYTESIHTNNTRVRLKFKDGKEFALTNIRIMYNAINTTEDSFLVAKTEADNLGNPVSHKIWNRGKEQTTNSFNIIKTFDEKYRELTSKDYRNILTTTTYTDKTDTVGEIITQTIKKSNQVRDKAYEVSIEKTFDGSAITKQTDANGNVTTFDYKGIDTKELEKDKLYKETYPDGSYVEYTYNREERLETMTIGNEDGIHTFNYIYSKGYLVQVVVDNTIRYTYNYDGIGNVKSIYKSSPDLASYNYVYRYDAGLPPYKTTTKFGKSYTTEFDEYSNPISIYETGNIDLVSTMEYDPNTKECKKINDFTNTNRNSTPQTVWTIESDSNKTVITASGRINLENTVYQKDGVVSEEEMTVGNDEFYTKFDYNKLISNGKYPDNRLECLTIRDKANKLMSKTNFTYNNLGRMSSKYIYNVWDETTGEEESVVGTSFGYTKADGTNSYICDNMSNVSVALNTKDRMWETGLYKIYTYDDMNNITNIRYKTLMYNDLLKDEVDDTTIANGTHYEQSEYVQNVSYEYDKCGKLVRENNQISGKTYLYNYDTKGNILQKVETAYTTGEIPETAEKITYNYEYNVYDWLVNIQIGETAEKIVNIGNYDSYGNPHSYNGNTLTWDGQRLVGYGATAYQYDMRGLRLSKTVNNVTTNYVYDTESRLVQETKGTQRINYLYNMNDLIGFTIPYIDNGVENQFPFYYIKDAQGNICYIVDNKGNLVVSYNYDAWGSVNKFFFKYGAANDKSSYSITLGTTTYTAQDIDNLNSHYYRGYYLDKETGFYYLTTRYYDPKVGRFISPDDPQYLDFEVAYGHNRYAYCCNNPVMYVDPEGCMAISLFIGLVVSFAIGITASAISQSAQYGDVNWLQAGVDGLFVVGSTALAYTGIGLIGSIVAGAGMGLAQYILDSAVFHHDFRWSGALIATGLGALGGLVSGRGAQHYKSIGSNLDETGRIGVKAILTAFDKYGTGAGYQRVMNLWGGRVADSLAKSISQNFTKSALIIWATTAVNYGISYGLGKINWGF